MIKSINLLNREYKNYKNVYEKIETEKRNNRLYKIKRGLYVNEKTSNLFYIANNIYSPSYVSFETALAFYGLIPERVQIIKSATFKKNKIKKYENEFGTFVYQDVYFKAYPYDIDSFEENGDKILIASKEKAILDTISLIKNINSIDEIKELLFEDLRINEVVFEKLDFNKVLELTAYYISRTIKLFVQYIKKELLS